MKPLPTWHSSSEELGREKHFVPRMEIGHAAHLTELLGLTADDLLSTGLGVRMFSIYVHSLVGVAIWLRARRHSGHLSIGRFER